MRDFGVAQNRRRVFMISILGEYVYTFPRPIPLKKKLKDYLEDEVDEKYYLSDKQIKRITESTYTQNARRIHDPNGIVSTLCARDFKDPKCVDLSLIQVGQMYGTEREPNPQAGRIYDPAGLSPTLDSMQGGNRMPKIILPETTNTLGVVVDTPLRIRKLTPLEAWRLMGIKDEDFYKAQSSGMSDSQLYKQAGNAIVVDVLYHIFKNLIKKYKWLR